MEHPNGSEGTQRTAPSRRTTRDGRTDEKSLEKQIISLDFSLFLNYFSLLFVIFPYFSCFLGHPFFGPPAEDGVDRLKGARPRHLRRASGSFRGPARGGGATELVGFFALLRVLIEENEDVLIITIRSAVNSR